MEPIELSADGLFLRAWQPSDAAGVHQACQDPQIKRWTTVPSPYLRRDADYFTGEYTSAVWTAEIAAPMGVFDASTGELLGSSGLVDLDLDERVGEIGTWVVPAARGRRVAERAGRAVATWAFEVLGLRLLSWRAEVGNHISRLTAERIGFGFDGVQRGLLRDRTGYPVDGWRGVLQAGEVQSTPPAWLAPGGPGTRRARAFGDPPVRIKDEKSDTSLRSVEADRDIDDAVAACRDPESVRWTNVPVPYLRVDAVNFLTHLVPTWWARGTSATFVIADAEDRFAGTIDIRFDPTDRACGEIGFMVAPWARNRGHAAAATRLICRWGFTDLGLERIVWRAHVGNDASRRVAEKAGFRVEGVQRAGHEQRGARHDAWVASLLPEDL